MNLKSNLPILLFGSFSALSAHSAVSIQMKLNHATVFFQGAELNHVGEFSVPEGESTLILTDLAKNLDEQTISVNLSPKVTILSTQIQTDFVTKQNIPVRLQTLKDHLTDLENQLKKTEVDRFVLQEEIDLLKANRKRFESATFPISAKEQNDTIELIKIRLPKAMIEVTKLDEAIEKLNEEITALKNQLGEQLTMDQFPQKTVLVNVYSPKATSEKIELNYVISDAGWNPQYDIRVNELTSPIKMTYLANIYQQTGIDWENIQLTLSTAKPYQGIEIPRLYPWNINLLEKNIPEAPVEIAADTAYFDSMKMRKNMGGMLASAPASKINLENRVVSSDSGADILYNINYPSTIQTHQANNVISIKNVDVPVIFSHISVPKLSPRVFLQAEIENWQTLNLLPGQGNIYVNGAFVGKNYLTTENIEKTLSVSLGDDKKVLIERKRNAALTSEPTFFGNSKSQKFAYSINVKNLRDKPIKLTIKDQLPVVENSSISLTDLNFGQAIYNKTDGFLTWNLELNAKENRVIPMEFSVKYPKDEKIIGL